MAIAAIARGLWAIGNIYFRWRVAKFAVDTVGQIVSGPPDSEGGKDSIRTDMPGSSAIDWIEYSPKSRVLRVRFHNRPRSPVYIFDGIPVAVWQGWLNTPSEGSYYHAAVKQFSNRR